MKEGWGYKKLGEVATIINGKNQKAVEDESGIYPICGSGGTMGYANDFLCPEQTVIIGRKGNINRPIYMEQKFWNVDTAFGIVANRTQLVPKYLYYFCIDFNFEKLNKAVTIPSLVKSDLLKIEMAVPPLSEQQHIVEELDLLSSIIEKKKCQLNELDNLAQSLFYEMFGESSNWECKQLKEITTKMGSGATPRGGNQSYKEDGVSLIRSLNVHNGHFKFDDLAHIDEQQASQLDNVTIKENDVLLNITGASVARCCIVPTDILPARVNQHVSILRVKENLLNSTYLCHCLISPNSQAELLIMSKSNAATREALPKATLEKYLVPIPPLDLQNQFAEKVQAIEHQKELIKQSIKEVETLFNSRMDYYFN